MDSTASPDTSHPAKLSEKPEQQLVFAESTQAAKACVLQADLADLQGTKQEREISMVSLQI